MISPLSATQSFTSASQAPPAPPVRQSSHSSTPLDVPKTARPSPLGFTTPSEHPGPPPLPPLHRPPPLHHRRTSSYIRHLELDATLDREKFGLGNVQISTIPDPRSEEIIIHLDTPLAMSSQPITNLVPTSAGSPPAINTRTTPAMNVPSSGRLRNPPPPSPLSKVSSPTTPAEEHESPPQMHLSPPALLHAQTSPCFIHSHLDRHGNGSLQEWLSQKGQASTEHHESATRHAHQPHHGSVPKPIGHSSRSQHHAHFAHRPTHHQSQPTPHRGGPSHPISPRRESALSGYESDRSSSTNLTGSALLDGDFLDDDEDSKSLTRQLAETAQGVREMSKELGRTRVRSKIQTVLIVTKARDNRLIKLTRELALYLMLKKPAASTPEISKNGNGSGNGNGYGDKNGDRGMVVYVDAQLRHSRRFDAAGLRKEYPDLFQPIFRRRSSSATSLTTLSAYPSSSSMSESARKNRDEGQLRYWTSEMCSNSPHLFDFVVTLGGDGTVLFTSWLFQKIVPPVLPFALGSLGFLTNFNFDKYMPTMDKVIDDGIRVNLRMRFTCTVYRAVAPEEVTAALNGNGKKRKAIKKPGGEILINQVDKGGWEALEGPGGNGKPCIPCRDAQDKEIMCFSTRPVEQFEVLNDLVVDRGPSPFVSLLELFGDEHHLTTVQADGLTVSTPTGSTAYSLSAGGSLVHPQIPALLITPICPHTLSFRPMLLPDSMELRICVPYNSRSTAWASFDGRGRVELKQGDHIKVTASKYPFPTVCADKASTDWFNSISRTLRWNEREKQKSFVVVEEDNEPSKPTPKKTQGKSPHKGEVKAAQADPKPGDSYFTKQCDEIGANEDEDEEDDDEEEEEYDIDEKSGGNTTPSSPKSEGVPANRLHSLLSSHKSGVDSPDRFVTPYAAPPPLSQRHLVEALAAELQEKEHESGQRDDIRGQTNTHLTNGGHMIPRGRDIHGSRPASHDVGSPSRESDLKTPRPTKGSHKSKSSPGRAGKSKKGESKAKAFAFFGHDESASDASDGTSE